MFELEVDIPELHYHVTKPNGDIVETIIFENITSISIDTNINGDP